MAYNQRNNQISKKENEMYLTERDLNVEIENEKRIRNKRSQGNPTSLKENDSCRTPKIVREKSRSMLRSKASTPTDLNGKYHSNYGDDEDSDARFTPKSTRKSAEMMGSYTPKSSLHSKCSNLNNSHPPLIRSANIASATGANRNGSKHSSTWGTPKGLARNPGTPGGTPCENGLNVDGGRCSLKRNSSSKVKIGLEDATHIRSTPLSAGSTTTPTSCSARKSVGGSINKNVGPLRRSSSLRKSVLQTCPASLPTNTPFNSRKRLSYPGFGGTPSDLYSLYKSDAQGGALHLEELEPRREDESSRVTVGVRVRPFSDREKKDPNVRNILAMEGRDVVVQCENGAVHSFNYDLCLWSGDHNHPNFASQEHVYENVARPLLGHAYEGYNVCLFAYGQTGSGKSYCIMGEDDYIVSKEGELSEGIGIIPRFCRDLFAQADLIHSKNSEQEEDKGVASRVEVAISYIEIYNERIYDLVSWRGAPGEDEPRVPAGGEKRDPLRVREHPVHGPVVVGASSHLVASYADVETWINLGNKQRSIAATGMNDKSSRSHSVFSVKLTQTQVETIEGEEMEHCLVSLVNIVDLAGSERVAASHSEGERLKEGVYINKSLLTLGKVITALAAESDGRKKVFIPYRESTLTWLLKESLGGNSKTTMIATVSPSNLHQEETLSTLRYAQQARKIVNWNHINEDATSKIIRALKLEVERLRSLQKTSPVKFSGELLTTDKDEEEAQDKDSTKDVKEREIIRTKELEISLLKEKLRATQEQFSERTKLWEDKLLESEARKREALERCKMKGLALKLEEKEPILVHLCEDPQLSQTLLYSLKKGSTTLGTSHADVTLSGLYENDIHCSIFYEDDRLVLHPKEETETYVNGKLITAPTQIYHNDRVVLAGIYFFRVSFPANFEEETRGAKMSAGKFDFLYARDELLKEQEERIRREMSIQQAATRDEMLRELEEQRRQLTELEEQRSQREKFLKENVVALSNELEEERNLNHETEMARLLLEEEKKRLEGQIRAWKGTDRQSLDRLSPSPTPTGFFDEMEAIFNDSAQVVEKNVSECSAEDVQLWFMLTEANNICSRLSKPYEFRQQSKLTLNGFEMAVLVCDKEHGLSASLDLGKVKELLNVLRDLASGERDGEDLLDVFLELSWERSDDFSKIPFVHNKMRENLRRSSLNSSFLNFSLSSGVMSPRRLSLRGGLNQNCLKPSTSSSIDLTSSLLAERASQVLLRYSSSSNVEESSPFVDALAHLVHLHEIVKDLGAPSRDPGAPSRDPDPTEDPLADQILLLTMLTPVVDSCLTRLGAVLAFPHAIPETALDLRARVRSYGRRLIRKAARMLQGVKNDVETLREDSRSDLKRLICEAVEDLGFLNLIAPYDLPGAASLASSLTICEKFLVGVSRGLEWKVKRTSSWIENECSLIASPPAGAAFSSDVRKCASKAVSQIAAFLRQFSQLKVEPSIEDSMTPKKATKEGDRFLGRVAAASDNLESLVSALASVARLLGPPDEGACAVEGLADAVGRLQESLGELIGDAGVGSAFEGSSEAGIAVFLEELHRLAMSALRRIRALRGAVQGLRGGPAPRQAGAGGGHPARSAFRSAGRVPGCEKKVRFDVSLSSSSVGSYLEDSDEEAMDV